MDTKITVNAAASSMELVDFSDIEMLEESIAAAASSRTTTGTRPSKKAARPRLPRRWRGSFPSTIGSIPRWSAARLTSI